MRGEEEERAAFIVGHDVSSSSPGPPESPHPGETATDTDIGAVSVGSAHSSSPAAPLRGRPGSLPPAPPAKSLGELLPSIWSS